LNHGIVGRIAATDRPPAPVPSHAPEPSIGSDGATISWHQRARVWLSDRYGSVRQLAGGEDFPWRTALMLPALMVLLQSYLPTFAQRLENAALSAAAALLPEPSAQSATAAPTSIDVPRVVVIDDALFQSAFGERTPLDRGRLARLLQSVLARTPKMLVIDLDLSTLLPFDAVEAGAAGDAWPGLAVEAENRAQAALDRVLMTATPTKIVLATPLPARAEVIAKARHEWMRRLCRSGVEFGFTTLFRSGGYVLRYDPMLPTLGVIAAQRARDAAPAAPGAARSLEPTACELADADAVPYFLRTAGGIATLVSDEEIKRLEPINPTYFRYVDATRRAPVSLAPPERGEALESLVVFLGGAYGGDDSYLTVLGRHEGVVLHAASYYTEFSRLDTAAARQSVWGALTTWRGSLAKARDMLLYALATIVTAFVLQQIWKRYFAALYAVPETAATLLRRYLWSLAAIASCALLLWIALRTSAWLMQHATWLNPLPLVLVVLFKAFFTARKAELTHVKAMWHGHASANASVARPGPSVEVASLDAAHSPPGPKSWTDLVALYGYVAACVYMFDKYALNSMLTLAQKTRAVRWIEARFANVWERLSWLLVGALLAWAVFLLFVS
jgi:hypothetical protein